MKASDIAARIRYKRERLNYSYADLARLTGMSKSTLQRYETGAIQDIPISKIKDIAKALEITEIELLGLDISTGPSAHTWSLPLAEAYAAASKPKQEAVCDVLKIEYVSPPMRLVKKHPNDPIELDPAIAVARGGQKMIIPNDPEKQKKFEEELTKLRKKNKGNTEDF